MREGRLGAWRGSAWPVRYFPAYPRRVSHRSNYSAVSLETGEVEWMELEGNSNSGTSVAFLTQLSRPEPFPGQHFPHHPVDLRPRDPGHLSPQACCRLSRNAPPSRHRATW